MEKSSTKYKLFDLLVVFTYAVITLILIHYHEFWRDEAQQWLIVKNLSFIDIIKQMKYEGHFLLWYLILMPFAKLGFPIITESIISWLILCCSVFLILKKAPFSYLYRVLFIFTTPVIYAYSVHSRSYSLIPLAIILCAMAYKNRKEKPFIYILSIVFLANTHIIMYGLICILILEYLIETIKERKILDKKQMQKRVFAFVLLFILLLLSVAPLFGSLISNKDIKINNKFNYKKLKELFVFNPYTQFIYYYNGVFSNILIRILLFVCTLNVLIYSFKNVKNIFFKIFFIVFFQWLIYVFIFGQSFLKGFSVSFIILFYVWTYKSGNKKNDISKLERYLLEYSIIILLVLNIFNAEIWCFDEISNNYSSSKETAQFIEESIPEDSILISGNYPEICSSIMVYTDKVKFYNIKFDDYYSFVTWDSKIKIKLSNNFLDDIKSKFVDCENLYYITNEYNKKETTAIKKYIDSGNLIELFKSKKAIDEEEVYTIYKINY